MSRTPSKDSTLATRDPAAPGGQEPMGGVFRLDALAPGSENGGDSFTPPKPKLSSQTLLLAVLLCAGVGLVYGMRVLGVGSFKNLVSASVPDYDITKTGVNKTLEHKKAIAELHASDIKTQVPTEEVQKNPFRMADSLTKGTGPEAEDQHGKQLAERLRRDSEARRKHIADSIAKMKVNSILGGPKPVARIDGEFVRIGDTVDELFTVKSIHGRSVELEADGQPYTLTMDEDLNEIHKPKHK